MLSLVIAQAPSEKEPVPGYVSGLPALEAAREAGFFFGLGAATRYFCTLCDQLQHTSLWHFCQTLIAF